MPQDKCTVLWILHSLCGRSVVSVNVVCLVVSIKRQCLVQSLCFKRLGVEWDDLPVSIRSHKYQ